MAGAVGGCFRPGGRFELDAAEGDDCEGLTPLTDVCTSGGGGRFIFGGWAGGLADIAVAIFGAASAQEVGAISTV